MEPYFSELKVSNDLLLHLKDRTNFSEKRFRKGDYLYHNDESTGNILFLKNGSAKVGRFLPNGRDIIKRVVVGGEILGLHGLYPELEVFEYAIAMEKTDVLSISMFSLKKIMRDNPEVFLQLVRDLLDKLLYQESKVEGITFTNSRNRVIDGLAYIIRKSGKKIGHEVLVQPKLTHQELGALTSTSRQTVNNVLNELKRKGILTFNRRRILIRDVERLILEKRD